MMRQNLENAEETNKHYLPVLISGGDLSKSASEMSFNSAVETNARHHSIAMASSVSNMTLLDPLDHISRVQSSMECGDLACEDGGSQVITIHENESEASCSPCSNTPDSSTNGSAWKLRVKFWPWFRHYVFDWVLTLVIFILAGSLLSTGWPVEPHLRYLAPSDPSLSMPLVQKETVPTWLLFTLCAFLPLAVFAVTQCFVKSGKDFHHAVLGLLEALSLTLLFTDVFKLYAGFYRPNWFQACNPGLDGVCQTPYSKTLDFRMSFPSGHSSLSFAGLVFLAMYLSGKLNLFGKHGGQLWKLLIVLTPLGLAGFVAVSRVVDYFHHPVDIVAGSMIGGTIGMLCYLMFYPSPFAPSACGVPKTRAPCISE